MDYNFTTKGMTLSEKYEFVKSHELIPIGTECYRSGDFAEDTTKIVVTEENQKNVTMFWNSLYFLKEEDANRVTWQAHAEYNQEHGEIWNYR